jgi:4-hydroxybutyrate dehydrogenase
MLQQFRIIPTIYQAATCKEFCEEFGIGRGDLIFTNPSYFEGYFDGYADGAEVVYLKKYGKGEPTDSMVEAIYRDIRDIPFKRMIAIGGGSIIDISKLLVQETVSPVADLYDKKIPTKKVKELVIVPTTCGTGSEVTSVAVIELTAKKTKLGLQTDEEFADYAVLIPELLSGLPFQFFATSSIDALIHAIESFVSPKATPFSELFSEKAMRLILSGYRRIAAQGEEARLPFMKDFLLASTYAGIAFGNAGCGAVHAMSMPFSGAYHVPHGEANYVIFTGVFKAYNRLQPEGKLQRLNAILAEELSCEAGAVYEELEDLLDKLLQKKSLREYGVKEEEFAVYTEVVMTKQTRLTANNYTKLDADEVLGIYRSLF